jgi:hypothetical protein
MVALRRSFLLAAAAAALTLSPPFRVSSQVAGISKLPWSTIFSALNAALAAIPLLKDWLQHDSSASKAVLCQLNYEDIDILESHCRAIAVVLDSNTDGPVVPPDNGSIGIIPALADFTTKQDRETIGRLKSACLLMLEVSQNFLREIGKDSWLSALRLAGLSSEDMTRLEAGVQRSRDFMADFLGFYKFENKASAFDIERAKLLSAQLSSMPAAAQSAIASIEVIIQKRRAAC